MHIPGYDPLNQIVAVDGEGTSMGFTVIWYDETNRVGHSETVGVHADFHRRVVGSVLLRLRKRCMRAAGMETATVWHSSAEQGAIRFYRSNGFEPVTTVTRRGAYAARPRPGTSFMMTTREGPSAFPSCHQMLRWSASRSQKWAEEGLSGVHDAVTIHVEPPASAKVAGVSWTVCRREMAVNWDQLLEGAVRRQLCRNDRVVREPRAVNSYLEV